MRSSWQTNQTTKHPLSNSSISLKAKSVNNLCNVPLLFNVKIMEKKKAEIITIIIPKKFEYLDNQFAWVGIMGE